MTRTQHELDPYWTLVVNGVAARNASKDAMKQDVEHKAPQYVVRLCEVLLGQIHADGAKHITLGDVIRLEGTCTGADYQHKLALRCQELARPATA